MMMHGGATDPKAEAPTTRNQTQTQTPTQLKERDVTNLYGLVAVVVLSVVPHTRLGNGDTIKTGGVHTGPQKLLTLRAILPPVQHTNMP